MRNTISKSEAIQTPNVKIGPRHQITIPNDVFKKLKLVAGDILNVDVKDGSVVLVPAKVIPRDQAWFWTGEWQEGEAEAEQDVSLGRLSKEMDSSSSLLKHLKSKKK